MLKTNQEAQKSQSNENLLTAAQVAKRLSISPRSVRRYALSRKINYVVVGSRLRFRPSAVDLFVSQREVRA